MADSGFTVFDEELLEIFTDQESYESVRAKIVQADEIIESCKHKNTFTTDDNIQICKNCGCEIESLDFEPEWRYYGASDNKSSRDPSRCHRSKPVSKGGIEKVFIECKINNIPLALKNKTEMKYKKIVGDETVRGRGRKAIVAACLLYVYRENNDVRTSEEVRSMFGLTKQQMSDGLTEYLRCFPDDRITSPKPIDLIPRLMRLTKIDMSHYKYILLIARCLDGVNRILNRSAPQSVASALIYLYLCLTPTLKESLCYTKTKFAKDVKLSDITITKLVKEAAGVLGLTQLSM
jgi:transcription initiation factor TFIIIB Brf1 subunit/transcription initiation factor TFIIB